MTGREEHCLASTEGNISEWTFCEVGEQSQAGPWRYLVVACQVKSGAHLRVCLRVGKSQATGVREDAKHCVTLQDLLDPYVKMKTSQSAQARSLRLA